MKAAVPFPKKPIVSTDHTARGHVERAGRHIIRCESFRLQKPKGGWERECAKLTQPRHWQGGDEA